MNAIVTINVPGFSKDKLYELCMKTQKKYADDCGADYIIIDEILKQRSENPDLRRAQAEDCFYTKLRAFQYLEDYEQVLYLDSDVMIFSHAPNIFDIYKARDCFYGRQIKSRKVENLIDEYIDHFNIEWERREGHSLFYNGGVMLVGNECDINGYEDEYISAYDEPYFAYLLQRNKVDNVDIGEKWNCQRKPEDHFEKYQDSYFVHYSGAGFRCNNVVLYQKVVTDYRTFGLK